MAVRRAPLVIFEVCRWPSLWCKPNHSVIIVTVTLLAMAAAAEPRAGLTRAGLVLKRAEVEAQYASEPTFEITVKTLTGKTMRFSVNCEESVADLKEKISEREGIRSEHQKLVLRPGIVLRGNLRNMNGRILIGVLQMSSL